MNISSEAGSIGAFYRTNMTDYILAKAALNMLCLNPGWMRTNDVKRKSPTGAL